MVGAENGGGHARGDRGEAGGGGGYFFDGPPTSIMHAAYAGALEVVKSLVERGVPADGPDFIGGSTPLHWACYGGHLDVVRWLVGTAGADVNKANADGCTPIFFACEKGYLGVAQWLVREAGAEVNVKDDVMWQTPLHRVFLLSRRTGAAGTEVDDLIFWLVEAGADLTAVDRFGNRVEAVNMSSTGKPLTSTGSGSKLGGVIAAAREEGLSDTQTRDKLKRRNAVRRKSGSDARAVVPQLSPRLEAKQRAPLSRRGSRKDSAGGASGVFSPNNTQGFGGSRIGPSGSVAVPEATAVDEDDKDGSDGGSGGGVAAPPAWAGSKMGGGPPAPVVVGEERGDAPLDSAEALAVGTAATPGVENNVHARRSSNDYKRRTSGGAGEQEMQQQESLRVAEEALRKTEVKDPTESAASSSARRRLEGAGTAVVDKIRELASDRRSGLISEEQFAEQKRQLLEMEQLRRQAEEEAQRRELGQLEDAGAGILTSVGQNTPPPSPKNGSENGSQEGAGSAGGNPPTQILAPTAEKDLRETYKASDIERYTSVKAEGPRVFGEVPESVKESLAAKEAARQEAAAAAAAAKKGDGSDKRLQGKKKSGSTLAKMGGGTSTAGSAKGAGTGAGSAGDNGGPGQNGHEVDSANQSSGGCKCAIM
ncbi:unnamed protein product [Pylaiella littoralis]